MTNGFQQQVPARNIFTRSVPEAQHGKKTDQPVAPETLMAKPKRSFDPRPGH